MIQGDGKVKIIYLFRHSSPDKSSTLPNELIPLSQDGESLAMQLVNKIHVKLPIKVFSSTYVRARQTAEAITSDVITDTRLIERKIGNKDTFTIDLWARQYIDKDIKNDNGESFRMVQQRMNDVINDILSKMCDNESAIVVSHAAAICAYLQQYCEIIVTDVKTKRRKIIFNNKTVLDGIIQTPSCFVLAFDDEVVSVSYID